MPLAKLLGSVYGVPGLKAALKLAGYDVGLPRPPRVSVPDTALKALQEALCHGPAEAGHYDWEVRLKLDTTTGRSS